MRKEFGSCWLHPSSNKFSGPKSARPLRIMTSTNSVPLPMRRSAGRAGIPAGPSYPALRATIAQDHRYCWALQLASPVGAVDPTEFRGSFAAGSRDRMRPANVFDLFSTKRL
jgi:hypothetical protein